MAGFGEELKLERERRGISLETLSARTKVTVRHFNALEQDDYDAMPGGVFRRGIVRSYLETVGLGEADWMPRFEASMAQHARLRGGTADSTEPAWATFATNVKRSRGPQRSRGVVRWLGVLLLVMALLGAGWAVWHFELHRILADNTVRGETVRGGGKRGGDAVWQDGGRGVGTGRIGYKG